MTATRTDAERAERNAQLKAWRASNPKKVRASWDKYYAKNKERLLAASKQWRVENPDRLKRTCKAYYDKNRTRCTAQMRGRRVGITAEEIHAMTAAQGNKCAMCGKAETYVRRGFLQALSVDHDHATGKVRGLLCNNCNRGIGLLGDSAATLRAGADYIDRHGERR
jgi:hypothetical protein